MPKKKISRKARMLVPPLTKIKRAMTSIVQETYRDLTDPEARGRFIETMGAVIQEAINDLTAARGLRVSVNADPDDASRVTLVFSERKKYVVAQNRFFSLEVEAYSRDEAGEIAKATPDDQWDVDYNDIEVKLEE